MPCVPALPKRLVLALGLGSVLAFSMASSAQRARVDGSPDAFIAARANKALGLRASSLITLKLDRTPGIAQQIALSLDGQPVVLDLIPHSVRSEAHYRLVAQQPDGQLAEIPPGPVRTLRGTVVGRGGSRVAASVLDDGLYARVVIDDDTTWWIQPLAGRVSDVAADLHVAYRAEDVLPHGGSCANQAEAFDTGQLEGLRHSLGSCGALCVAELACDADTEYFNSYGSVAATEARINSVINTVNLQYESQVSITHQITTIIVRTTSDPYTSTSPDGRLCQFITEWTNNQSAVVRDVAHLFTGVNIDGTTIGIAADIGGTGICVNSGSCTGGPFGPRGSYCLAESDFNGSFSCATDLSAHELGHLWGAFHCSCPSNTMNSGITCANNFSSGSISSITAYRNSRTCLSGSGTPVCGNGVVEVGEQCEPPNTSTCDANCQLTGNPACGAGAGDCCTANGTPGCNQTACCNARCVADPFCCNNNWDQTCANDAQSDPNCTCGGGSNNACADAFVLFDGNTPFDSTGATTDGPAHTACLDGFSDDQVGSDIWYDYTASCSGELTVSLCGSANYDTKLAIYNGCACPASALLECDDDTAGCSGNTSQVSTAVVSGTCYKVRIGGFNGATGTGNITVSCVPTGCTPPDCNDGNACTTDTCNGGSCSNTPNSLPCDDGNACTLTDTCAAGSCGAGPPVDCSGGNTECLSVSCNPSGPAGNCAVSTPINEGGLCGGGAGVCTAGQCVIDPGATAVFLTTEGLEEIADTGSSNTALLPSGGNGVVAVWVRHTEADAVGGYQVALPGAATPLAGSGSVSYLDLPDGSVAIDTEHPSWIYAGRVDASNFLSETGLPVGFALLSALPLGQGEAVASIAYLGQFGLTTTLGTCGTFALPLLPDGAQPNGGTGLVDNTGAGQVAAFLQPLTVIVGAPNNACDDATALLGNDVSVDFDTACATTDGPAHPCGSIGADLWWSYTATCSGTLTISTTSGCAYDTALAVYDDATCPATGSALIACSDTPGGCETTAGSVTIGDRRLIRVGSLSGNTGSGVLSITCDPSATTPRVFMARPGTESAAAGSGATALTMGAGQTALVEVWVADPASVVLGGYQIALQGRAVSNGAAGTVVYSPASVAIDTADADWIFAPLQPQAQTFLSETGLPAGFALLSALDIGQGVAVDGLAYLGAFALRASATAEGSFTINFLPDGAPPNGGSGLIDSSGVGAVLATYQPLHIIVVPEQPCTAASDCGDLNGNGVTDDACLWFECAGSACNAVPRIFGDVGGSFGTCPIDGFANIHDKNHVLTCFNGTNLCDPINIDVGGAFGDCNPDGFCNIHDANHTLTAFSGLNTCSCPLDGGPAPELPPTPTERTALRVIPRHGLSAAGPTIEVDIVLDRPVSALQGYQLEVRATAPRRSGALRLVDIRVDDRKDRALTGAVFEAFNVDRAQMLRAREDLQGMAAVAGSYLATYVYAVDRSAIGPFRIDVVADGQTYLVAPGQYPIAIDATIAAEVTPGMDRP